MRRIIRDVCPASRHDRVGYQGGGCRCTEALLADRRYRDSLKADPTPRFTDTLGTRRRIHALHRIGYTRGDLVRITGLVGSTLTLASKEGRRIRASTTEVITVTYDRLSGVPNPTPNTYGVALARGRGWHGPWCWTPDSIDDPVAVPLCEREQSAEADDYDTAVLLYRVERDSLGRRLTIAERRNLAVYMYDRLGMSRTAIARILGSSGTRINELVDADR